jgi:putative membrane-bound dehydrogenase-like protein
MNRALGLILLTLVTMRLGAFGAEPLLDAADLPRFPPVPAEKALETFQVRKGFHLELVAAEPNIASPVALSFDENGRMFVVEMVDYSERRDETPHLGRIRLLEDLDGDGIYEKSTIFATNLAWPTAVFCYNGGVFVAATPDILYLKDTNGDGKADVRETVFTGFAEGVERINVQAMLNTFIWGLDNRIHGATSGNGGMVRSLRHPEVKVVDLHGRDFVIEPRSITLASEAGGGQHGLSFDDTGRRFACNNSDHIRLFLYDDSYGARNPFYSMPSPLASIAVDGPAAEVYRISPEEPWRVIRTHWRVAGLVPGPIEGGGRASGYFTGATGTTIYRGNAYPRQFLGNAFVADCGGNLIHRKILVPDGIGLKAQRDEDEQTVEFIASRDTWFRPVQFANAPDGTLYVIDMYREIIEHPWSLPDSIKRLVDLNSGNDRGRIYRIAPDGFRQPASPRLGRASTAELVATLEHHNGWHRDTAARLLYEKRDQTAVPLLTQLLKASSFPLARLHALYVLDGLDALSESHLQMALSDLDGTVRKHAIKLAEKFLRAGKASTEITSKLSSLTSDPDILVRFQLAFTIGELPASAKTEPLSVLTRRDAENVWVRAAVLSSLADGGGELFTRLSNEPTFCHSSGGQDFLRGLAGMIGSRNEPQEVARVLDFVGKISEPSVQFALVHALAEGLKQRDSTSPGWSELFQRVKTTARDATGDPRSDETTRREAIGLLGLSNFSESGQLLLSLLDQGQPQIIQIAAVSSLNHFNDRQVGDELVKRWDNASPRLRSEMLAVLLARPERAIALLVRIQAGTVQRAALGTVQSNFLRSHPDPEVRKLASQVLELPATGQRQSVIEAFMPALNLQGNPIHGRKVYQERCLSCHRLGGEGHAVGPDLVTVKNTGKEKLLVNILDPNREVRPDFVSYVVETENGESLVGLIANETSTALTVRQAYGKEDVLQRSRIHKLRSQSQSLMPEGLEAGLGPQDLADLLEYIEQAKPEEKP